MVIWFFATDEAVGIDQAIVITDGNTVEDRHAAYEDAQRALDGADVFLLGHVALTKDQTDRLHSDIRRRAYVG